MSDTEQRVRDAIAEALAKGWVEEAGPDANGEPTYRITPAGRAEVERMLADVPEAPRHG